MHCAMLYNYQLTFLQLDNHLTFRNAMFAYHRGAVTDLPQSIKSSKQYVAFYDIRIFRENKT